jgi:glycosyltransferase involved in cell wall biosynthesis
MNQIKLSFVIPVYNVEAYLEECVNSIINQGETGIEIILVDDGSTDRSAEICDKLTERHQEILTVHQNNSGVAIARNHGLLQAKGEYVAFIDADDFISETSIKRLLDWIEENTEDICLLKGYKYYSNGRKVIIDVYPPRNKIKNKPMCEALDLISRCEKFSGSACTKIFKRSFLKENALCFPVGRKHGEDLEFVMKCLALAKSIDYLDIDYYFYRQGREGSATNSNDRVSSFNDISKFVVNTIEFSSRCPERKIPLYRFAAYEYAVLLNGYVKTSRSERRDKRKFFKDNEWLMQYGTSKRIKIIRLCIALFGFTITSFLIRLYMKTR